MSGLNDSGGRSSLLRENALLIARLLEEHKGADVVLLDLRSLSACADFFIIATVTSGAHLEGLKKYIKEFARTHDIEILNRKNKDERADGTRAWDLIDMGGIVVHLMGAEARAFYELENLWRGAGGRDGM